MPAERAAPRPRAPRIGLVSSRTALFAVSAAGFTFAVNYTNHAPLAPTLMRQFGFDQARAGLLTTGIFLSHAVMQIPGGHLADRFGAHRVMAVSLALLLAGNLALASSAAYWQLLLFKIVLGFGTGTCFLAGARYIAGSFAGAALDRAQGLYGGSIVLGSGFVIFAVPPFLHALGWRGVFLLTALLGAAVLVAWIGRAPASPPVPAPPVAFYRLLRCGELWCLGIVQMASFGLAIVAGTWTALLFQHELGWSAARAGLAGSLVLLLGIVSRPLGGALRRRTGTRPLFASSLLGSAAGCVLLALPHPAAGAAFAGVLLLGIGTGLPYAALFNRAAALFPGRAGAAMGVANTLGICFILAGAPAVGRLADLTGDFHAGFRALAAFTVLAALAILGIGRA